MRRVAPISAEVRALLEGPALPCVPLTSALIGAAQRALAAANPGIKALAAIKSHKPFAVNDSIVMRETGGVLDKVNNDGCSLISGHPQAPAGMRTIIGA